MGLSDSLDALVARLAFDLDPEARRRLLAWIQAAEAWNAKLDLTAARSPAGLVEILVLDVLEVSALIPLGATVLDVGTGAGAPGLGLALLRPDLRVACVEPLAKRVAFLRTVVGASGVQGRVAVSGARIDPAAPALPSELERFAPGYDLAVSRATFSPPVWAAVGLQLAPEAVLMLVDETPALPPAARPVADRRYEVPSSGAPRRLVKLTRSAA